MRIPGAKTLRQSIRKWRSRRSSNAIILGYHRVAAVEEDPYSVCISPQLFSEHLEYLTEHFRVISAADLAEGLRSGVVPKKAVVVTIDDGYSDTLHQALPLLEKYRVPATVFISTAYMGKMFWWDEMNFLMKQALDSIRHFPVETNGSTVRWFERLKAAANQPGRSWAGVLQEMYREWMLLAPEEILALIAEVRKQVNFIAPAEEVSGRGLTKTELQVLADHPLITIGSHTIHHPILTTLTSDQQSREIAGSKYTLETILDRTISAFSFPNGKFDDEIVASVAAAGYDFACCSFSNSVSPNENLYALPRLWPEAVSKREFARSILQWVEI